MVGVRIRVLGLLCMIAALAHAPGRAQQADRPAWVPWPRQVELGAGELELPKVLRLFAPPLVGHVARALREDLERIGQESSVVTGFSAPGPGDVIMSLDGELAEESYRLIVTSGEVRLIGRDAEALAYAAGTFLQLFEVGVTPTVLPQVTVEDSPDYRYRGLLLDVARFWHPVEVLYDTVDLARVYKIRYLHLHLSDDQSFTFPSQAFPDLVSRHPDGSRRHYTRNELMALVAYADARGVTLVPEIDVPAHAGVMVGKRPDLFGTMGDDGKFRSTRIVNMASEKAYQSLEVLLGEVAEVFASSPYLHLGADEVGASHLRELPEYATYCKAHGLVGAAAGDVNELYIHFVARVAAMVTELGKRPVAWEGFRGVGTEHASLPRDLLMMSWALHSNPPQDLVAAGFEIINCAWWPLYIVPPQTSAPFVPAILDWNPRVFARRETRDAPLTLPADAPILGAQICMWEQRPEAVIALCRDRLAAMAERTWRTHVSPPTEFELRWAKTDRLVGALMRAVPWPGLEVSDAAPAYRYRLFGDVPYGLAELPADWGAFTELDQGQTACVDDVRIRAINDAMFAKVKTVGHIDTRVPKGWNPFGLELVGQLRIPEAGEWTVLPSVRDGVAELEVGGIQLAHVGTGRSIRRVGTLPAGVFPFRIRYLFNGIQNDLNLMVQGPGMTAPVPFEQLVLARAEHEADRVDAELPADTEFSDPGVLMNRNLATGRPVKVTGGSQGPNVPANAVDGILSNDSGWHCGSSPENFTVDLESVHTIDRVRVVTYYDGSRYYQYTVRASTDGNEWFDVVNARDNARPSDAEGFDHRFEAIEARYLRLEMLFNSANPGVHVNEFMVYGPK